MSFSHLGLNVSLLQALSELEYNQPTPIQKAAISAILQGQDVMAGAQTGTGKTAAFALAILQMISVRVDLSENSPRPVQALILTPTRELAQQVHRSFCNYGRYSGLRAVVVYGGASLSVQAKELAAGVDVLVATPGRLLDLLYNKKVQLQNLQTLVFDEADRMLDMGFIDEIQRVLKYVPAKRQTLLFSATFDSAVFELSKSLLNNPQLIEVDARNTAAVDVEQIVYSVDEERKRELISYLIGSKNWQQVLVFTRTKQSADALVSELIKDGLKSAAIHGDKSQGARDKALQDFKDGKVRVLVATDVASRGLDIPQLHYVVNYELPYIAEDYIHRIGRTGRAGNTGMAISLLSFEEEYLLEEIEAVLDKRLGQQWLEGFEPDMTKERTVSNKNSRAAQKKRAKARGFSKAKKRR